MFIISRLDMIVSILGRTFNVDMQKETFFPANHAGTNQPREASARYKNGRNLLAYIAQTRY